MASKENQNHDETAIENLNSHLTSAGQKLADNKKIIYWIICALLIVGVLIMAYLFLYRNPREEKAFEAFNNVEIQTQGNDSIAAIEYGKVAKKYGSTDGGKLASLAAAEAYYNLGKYKDALNYMKNFSTGDEVLQANAYVLEGDCNVNLKKYDEALSLYDKAISESDKNPQIAPRALLKKANIYDAQKKYDKALECYEEIKNDYPEFIPGNNIPMDAYIEREKARLGK